MTRARLDPAHELDAFLRRAADGGGIPARTADAYRTACAAVLAAQPGEVDLRTVEPDVAVDRFVAVRGARYTRQTLDSYRSRFRTAVALYREWADRPELGGLAAARWRSARAVIRLVSYEMPLRPGLLVRFTLPSDLTHDDADRVASFVRSLAFGATGGGR